MLTFFLTLSLSPIRNREFNQFGRYEEQRKKKGSILSFFSLSFSCQMEFVEIP